VRLNLILGGITLQNKNLRKFLSEFKAALAECPEVDDITAQVLFIERFRTEWLFVVQCAERLARRNTRGDVPQGVACVYRCGTPIHDAASSESTAWKHPNGNRRLLAETAESPTRKTTCGKWLHSANR